MASMCRCRGKGGQAPWMTPMLMAMGVGRCCPWVWLAGQAAHVDVSVLIIARVFLQEASKGGRGHERSRSPPHAQSLSSCLFTRRLRAVLAFSRRVIAYTAPAVPSLRRARPEAREAVIVRRMHVELASMYQDMYQETTSPAFPASLTIISLAFSWSDCPCRNRVSPASLCTRRAHHHASPPDLRPDCRAGHVSDGAGVASGWRVC